MYRRKGNMKSKLILTQLLPNFQLIEFSSGTEFKYI